ncbi:MAG: GNAT family N-acetyltransferase [Cyanobacteria bacterium J06642_9]
MVVTSVITQHPYRGEVDLEAIAALVNLCDAVDQLDRGTSVAELQESYTDPDFDPAQDVKLWHDETGRLLAHAELWRSEVEGTRQSHLTCHVHPDVRHDNLETTILNWAEQQGKRYAQAANLPGELHVAARDKQTDWIALYKSQGYVLIREFYQMARSLAEPIPESPLPEGYYIRQVDYKTDGEAWIDMFNQSFIDHWNHEPMTLEQYNYYTAMVEYDPKLDQIAVTPDGTLAAFCYCKIHAQDNLRKGAKEGWVNVLGTRRGYRQQGLGRAMLSTGLRQLKAAGMATALLGVDSINPSGALKLYQSVGFQQLYTTLVYQKMI